MQVKYTYQIFVTGKLFGFIPYRITTIDGSFTTSEMLGVKEMLAKRREIEKQAEEQLKWRYKCEGIGFSVSLPRKQMTIR